MGSEVRQLVRRPPETPQSTSQVNPGRTAENSDRHANERRRAHTCGSVPRRQTTMACIKAGKRVVVGKRIPLLQSHAFEWVRDWVRVIAALHHPIDKVD